MPVKSRLVPALLPLLCTAALSAAQAQTGTPPAPSPDASWAKTYAADCGTAMKHPCPPSSNGYENQFNGDPRLPALLKSSLPQRESWWVNGHAGSAPVSRIVQEFIGVPKDLFVDNDRYVTASGCVPHDCTTHGMLWIDTATPSSVVFLATGDIQGFTASTTHLWVYTSRELNFEALPPHLLSSIERWHNSIVDPRYDPQKVTLATLVEPNGRSRDLNYDMLFYKQNAPQSHPGAKQ